MTNEVPTFRALLLRHDITERDALVYGAVAVYQRLGRHPKLREIAEVLGLVDGSRRSIRRSLASLERAGLIRRTRRAPGRGNPGQIELLGPR